MSRVGRVVVFGLVTGVLAGGAVQLVLVLVLACLGLRRVDGAVLRVVPLVVLHCVSHVVTHRTA